MKNPDIPNRFLPPAQWEIGRISNFQSPGTYRVAALETHAHPDAKIFIGVGLSEYAEKYIELARDFNRQGCNVYVMTWRSQGGSDPLLRHAPMRRHSEGLGIDVNDLRTLVQRQSKIKAPNFYVGHSVGALVGLLLARQDPNLFRGMILNSPPLAFMHRGARLLGETVLARGPMPHWLLEQYIPGGRDWTQRTDPSKGMLPHDFSSDPMRMHLHDAWMIANPTLRVGSPTMGFVQATSKAILGLRAPDAAKGIKTPILLFSAGQDKIVRVRDIFDFASHFPASQMRHIHVPHGKHEIFMETDDILQPVLKESHDFIHQLRLKS